MLVCACVCRGGGLGVIFDGAAGEGCVCGLRGGEGGNGGGCTYESSHARGCHVFGQKKVNLSD